MQDPYPPAARRGVRCGYGRGERERHIPQPPGARRGRRIVYDPALTDYRELLEFFFQIHDPTTMNRRGNDVGTSYRSAIFYSDEGRSASLRTPLPMLTPPVCGRAKWYRGRSGGRFLGSRARTSGLSAAFSRRLHLSLAEAGLEASAAI